MKPSPTDIDPLPHRWPNLRPLTGLSASQVHTVCTVAQPRLPTDHAGAAPEPTAGR